MSKESPDSQLLSSEIKLYYLQNLAERRPGRENRAMTEYELNLSDSWHLSVDRIAAEQELARRKNSRVTSTANSSLYRLQAVAQTGSGKVNVLRNKQAGCTLMDRFPLLYFARWLCRLLYTVSVNIIGSLTQLTVSPMPHGSGKLHINRGFSMRH